METNSNLKKAVRQMLESAGNGVTFVELVRKLWDKGFDPSREQVQEALRDLCDEQYLFLFDGKLVLDPDDLPDTYPLFYVIEPDYDVEEAEELLAAAPLGCDIQTLFSNEMVAVSTTPEHAYHDAITDWTGQGHARLIWRADAPDKPAVLQWVQLGAATLRQPAMPAREPVKVEPSEDMWVKAETEAVRRALSLALNDNDYRRLRRDAAEGVVKLSFSVKVHVEKHICEAVMSGNIKLTNDAELFIENPAQMKLDL